MKLEDMALHDLRMYFPSIFAMMVSYNYHENFNELIVRLDDNSTVVFDCFEKSIRNLPKDSNAMTEEECRRELGLKLRKLMMKKHVTQADLSDRTQIPQAQISNYIRGKTTPSFYTIDKIAKVLGCSADDLRYLDF